MTTDYEVFREEYSSKEEFINDIVIRSKKLEPGDRGLVYDYGYDEQLKLYISKDDDLDLRIWVDRWSDEEESMVEVEESGDNYFDSVRETGIASFRKDLERIWNEDYNEY